MYNESTEPGLPQYPVSLWEILAIASSGLLIVAVGLTGLGLKFIRRAFNPQRAEAIAHSLIDYTIPHGSQGIFGANIGSAKIALVRSNSALGIEAGYPKSTLPELELLIARFPEDNRVGHSFIEETTTSESPLSRISFSYEPEGFFQVTRSRTESHTLCGTIAPVTIQTGSLKWPGQPDTVAASRYETSILVEDYQFVIVVSAIGDSATQNATEVFHSLQCKS